MTDQSNEKRVMFEIYREVDHAGKYCVVYFTELGEHERELEIGAAFRGDHVFDGFILTRERAQAKQVINGILDRLNGGEPVPPADIARQLAPYMP
jgi:hypothetical protein